MYEDKLNENLLFFENELNLENQNLKQYKNIYLILLSNEVRKLKLEQKVIDYKSLLIDDQKKRFKQIQIIDEVKLQNLLEKSNTFDGIEQGRGENYN